MNDADAILREPLQLARSILEFYSGMASRGLRELAGHGSLHDCDTRSGPRGRSARLASRDEVCNFQYGEWLMAGNNIQEGIVDLASNSSTLATVDPGQIADVASDILCDPMRSLCCLVPDRNTPIVCEEFRNKAEVFSWVLNAQSIMQLPDACHYVPLADLVELAYCHDTFQALWLVEGLGHYYADASWERGERPEGLLTDPETRGIPERALMMLHAGLGLSYGDRLLKTLDQGWTTAQVRKVIGQFICLCEANSRPGYTGAAFESLGLIAQAFHPALVGIVNRVIMESYPEIFEYYWHGIGRGHYFSFRYFLPFCASTRRALHHAQGLSPYVAAQQNAVAGFAWGVTMVNLESPLVIATLLAELRESGFAEDAFSYGIWSSVLMRQGTTPDAPFTYDFVNYRPPRAVAGLWQRIVAGPVHHAMDGVYGELVRNRQFEKLFRLGAG